MTSVFSITIQRWMVSTSLPEKSSTMVIKMLYQVLKDSRKASKSCAETYAKVTRLCDETRLPQVPIIAQWLEPLTADQQVPGSIPDGDHG